MRNISEHKGYEGVMKKSGFYQKNILKGNAERPLKLKKTKLNFNNFYAYLLMVLPVFIVFVIFYLIPSLSSFLISFTNYNGASLKFNFVGMKNYYILFKDSVFLASIGNTLIFTVAVTIIQNIFGVLFAVFLNQSLKMKKLYRTLVYAPALLNAVVAAFIWTYIFDTNGTLNMVLKAVGMGAMTKTWLGNMDTALMCVIISHIWRFIGYSAVIYLANLQSIPHDLYEAAEVDGATGIKKFTKITFPLLAPSTTINVSLALIGTFKVFDIIFAMTEGGPGSATETVATYIVKNMNENLYGYAAAMSIILFLATLVLNIFVYGYLKKREVNE